MAEINKNKGTEALDELQNLSKEFARMSDLEKLAAYYSDAHDRALARVNALQAELTVVAEKEEHAVNQLAGANLRIRELEEKLNVATTGRDRCLDALHHADKVNVQLVDTIASLKNTTYKLRTACTAVVLAAKNPGANSERLVSIVENLVEDLA